VTKRDRAAREGRKGDEAEKDATPTTVVAEFAKGTQVDRYVLEEAIGEGGTGQVYRAFDATTNRYVAMKVLGKSASDTMRERFLREIEVQANLRHPNIMPVFDRGEFEGRPYFTMELLYRPFTLTQIVDMAQGGTIGRYTTLRPFEEPKNLVRDVMIPVCEAIYVANVENGVVHRDLKPDNVLVDSRTLRPYVIDFGICHVLERRERFSTTVLAPTAEDAGIVGTPRFLAPEQARGAVHERTDVWGLGAILLFLFSGEAPIAASAAITRAELKRRIEALREAQAAAQAAGDERKADLCAEKLARLEDQGLRTLDDLFHDAREGVYAATPSSMPASLAAVARKALAPKTADRYVNARQMAGDLHAWMKGTKALAHAEHGHATGVAVESAKRALKRWLVTGLLLGGAAALGFFVAAAWKGGKGASAAGRLDDVLRDLDHLQNDAKTLGERASSMSALDAGRAYDILASRLERLRERIDASPGSASDLQSVRNRAQFVAQRFGPSWVRVKAPGGVKVDVVDVGRDRTDREQPAATMALKPGEYRFAVGTRFRAPLRIPYAYRDEHRSPDSDREAVVATVDIPVDPASVPEGMVLVAGASVAHRGPPFSEAPAVSAELKSFLIDEFEVRNRAWAQFLDSVADEGERARLVPATGFQQKPDDAKRFQTMSGFEDLPVLGVSADDALAFCAWRTKKDGATTRLPNEAEWVLVAGGAFREYVLPGGALGTPAEVAGPLRKVTDVPDLGDEPFEAAIRRLRWQGRTARDPKAGLRCVREISAP
jgi:serine/threonine-protein kinase